MSTPALARATDWLRENVSSIFGPGDARDFLSAALHDPDDAIVEALRTEFAYRMRTSAARGREGQRIAAEDIDNAAQCALDKVRAAILGSE